jgi:hypothetical protein
VGGRAGRAGNERGHCGDAARALAGGRAGRSGLLRLFGGTQGYPHFG